MGTRMKSAKQILERLKEIEATVIAFGMVEVESQKEDTIRWVQKEAEEDMKKRAMERVEDFGLRNSLEKRIVLSIRSLPSNVPGE